MAKPRLFWVVFAAMLVPCLVMNLRTAPRIEELAGGARLLEMRLTGYSFDEARGFVTTIGDEGARLYLDVQLWLDMAFPLLLGVVLFLGYRWLFPGRPGRIIGTISLGSILVEYLENAAVAAMLRAGADGMTPQMAATANFWTTTKWGLAFVGAVTLLVGIALRLRRR